ncbi:methionine ABC transporter ATP-binding protein [Actinoalloteichus hymeniacidonis]|uniref:ABC-type metal ion transport system, ATPase component n=1 Tax=Actinoalloteichus hymeniacidonis TaxID=340345 RepID=A0AAC9HQM0_9PSEU|nr:ATP-binding cassette domain-containing protein [Actinoalloteichus hymeniacidonis]AOS63533.1 ABC-type metal ion transport system, ATPase component [Actinoalloteichus hymeniacidonis]MBB5908423.1 D-methionine transport system ATP-binding protein [Actinoalloteichus hymeniacidonis]
MSGLIEFRGVTKVFESGGRRVTALDGIDLSIDAGDVFAIIGYSGAGKSTLVRLVNALETATEGSVLIDGTDITRLSERRLRTVRLGIGMIFQQFNLMRSRTVFGNVAYPLTIAGWDRQRRTERVTELLDFVGITEKAWHYPDQLSGGQKQRVGIARALATNPTILLADEATSALDPETTGEVLRLLKRVNTELGVTILVITHEMEVVRQIADRVAVLDAGRIVEQGRVIDVFAEPRTQTTRRFVATVLHDQPDGDDLARLRTRHGGRLITARIRDDQRIGTTLSSALSRHQVRFEIVYGGIKELGGEPIGRLTLELIGPPDGVDALIAELRETTEVEELAA